MAQYTAIFTKPYEGGYENLPSQNTPITADALNAYDDAIENVEEYLASDESQSNLADAYDETATYDLGDYAIYGGDLYKCTTAVTEPEEWNSTKWESCLITDEMGNGSGGASALEDLTDVNLTSLADGQIIKWDETSEKWINGGSHHEIIRQTSISVGNLTSITLNLTHKYTNPYVVALNALPLSKWGGIVCLQDSTQIEYDDDDDTLTFSVYTNSDNAQNYNIDWLVFEKSM